MKDCIVSFASRGREDYRKGLTRLIDSVIGTYDCDMLVYSPDHEFKEYHGVKIHKGWPKPKGIPSLTHQEMPYQFKTALIQEALEKGYERIIWLDSSMIVMKDLAPLFDEQGVTFFENIGHPTYKYLGDHALKLLQDHGLVNDEIENIPQVWGGAFAMDFSKPNANNFFDRLKDFSLNGSFKDGGSTREDFVAHRHDQAVMSVLAYHRCDLLPYGNILCAPHHLTGEYGNDPYLLCLGI